MLVADSVALADVRVSDAGYLTAIARTARTGVQVYRGSEVGKPELATVNVFRDESEVFSKRSLDTFAGVPITVDHPAEPVSSINWKRHAVGETGDEVLRDGEHLKIGIKIKDAAAVEAVKAGKRELSVGYSTDLVWENGVAPDGTPYQARQTGIVANHIAIVAAGRAGPQCRIGDSWAALSTTPAEDHHMADKPLKTVTVDGLSIETTDQGAQVIEKLQRQLGDATAALAKASADHTAAIAARDKELGTRDAEIAKLKADQLDAAKLDKLVSDRADVLARAKAVVADVDTTGKSIPDIRRAVVAKKLGDAAVKDKSDDYVEALFDGLAKVARPSDPVRDAIGAGLHSAVDADKAAADAYAQMVKDMQSGAVAAKAN